MELDRRRIRMGIELKMIIDMRGLYSASGGITGGGVFVLAMSR
jgi:hypothetical protein